MTIHRAGPVLIDTKMTIHRAGPVLIDTKMTIHRAGHANLNIACVKVE